ncbi:MAG: PIG-L family deacetylase [Christensenellales bacterium]
MKKIIAVILVFLFLPVISFAKEPETISFLISGKSASKLTDNKINTYISFPPEERITISCLGYCAIMLKWYKPAAYSVEFFDSYEKKIGFEDYDNGILNQYIKLRNTAKINICLPLGGSLSDIIMLSGGDENSDTQIWDEPYNKADVLVISAHPDDEYLYMGGTIPYCTENGLQVTVAWMSHQKRLRQDEALAALWAMGVGHYPEFVGFPDKLSRNYKDGAKIWGGENAVLSAIVKLYRKYKPEVVVTHDLKGEYGHGAHMITAAMALKAAAAAADETQFTQSAREYGAWQIKKLYLHLYHENKIIMDWNRPLEAFGGKTALDMAKAGYSYHKSQHVWNFHVSDTSRYSCAKFGLAFTAVGLDIEKNDFLENIPVNSLSNYVQPKPEPTIESAIEPVFESKAVPTQKSPPIISAEPARQTSPDLPNNSVPIIMLVSAVLFLTAIVILIWFNRKAKR